MEDRHVIRMTRPADWPGNLWRGALPLGNGTTGALITGGAGREHILLNRHDLWHWGQDGELPDVHQTLEQCRRAIDRGDYPSANTMLSGALERAGYRVQLATPFVLSELEIEFQCQHSFRHYLREIDLLNGEARIQYEQGNNSIVRRAILSRARDVLAYEISAQEPLSFSLRLGLHDTHDQDYARMVRQTESSLRIDYPDAFSALFWAQNDDGLYYGTVIRLLLPQGGRASQDEDGLQVSLAPSALILAACFSRAKTPQAALEEALGRLNPLGGYEALKKEHAALHARLYRSADIELCGGQGHTNEQLLEEAWQQQASPELLEKLWRFGRYLFISGTRPEGSPFPLYGLWQGEYAPMWSQHVGNENVQIIYWHCLTGGLMELVPPLIHYYYKKMDAFRESARKLFGLKGLYVSAYTTPRNSLPAPPVPVILNFTGTAGWLCRHFYEYYLTTGDEQLLRDEILPFMMESAEFYQNYLTPSPGGTLRIYPSVSPENSPANFIPRHFRAHMTHANPVAENATMEVAIIKELFHNLLELSEHMPELAGHRQAWQAILEGLPQYQLNAQGAVKEWLHPDLEDHYLHRHLSHLYPVFPGNEINQEEQGELMAGFRRAVELRELGGQSGWSLAHMASIYARLGQGEAAAESLDTLCKGCVLDNFFTLHNDYRDMGVTLTLDNPPVQLDALMGAVNALQEMLISVSPGRVELLPALPRRLSQGRARGLRYFEGEIDLDWDLSLPRVRIVIRAGRNNRTRFILPALPGMAWRFTAAGPAQCTLEGNALNTGLADGAAVELIGMAQELRPCPGPGGMI